MEHFFAFMTSRSGGYKRTQHANLKKHIIDKSVFFRDTDLTFILQKLMVKHKQIS